MLRAVIHSPAHQNQQEMFDARPSRPATVLSFGIFRVVSFWVGLTRQRLHPYFDGVEKKTHQSILLLMEEILHQLIRNLSHYLQGFIHPRWCRISSINSTSWHNHWKTRGQVTFQGRSVKLAGGVTIPQNAILSSKSFKTIMKHLYGKWTSTGIPHTNTPCWQCKPPKTQMLDAECASISPIVLSCVNPPISLSGTWWETRWLFVNSTRYRQLHPDPNKNEALKNHLGWSAPQMWWWNHTVEQS